MTPPDTINKNSTTYLFGALHAKLDSINLEILKISHKMDLSTEKITELEKTSETQSNRIKALEDNINKKEITSPRWWNVTAGISSITAIILAVIAISPKLLG